MCVVSPRNLRPHTVVIRNKLKNEVDEQYGYQEITLKRVKFQGSKKDSVKKEDVAIQDRCEVIIDCRDIGSKRYVPYEKWDEKHQAFEFTIHAKGDEIIYNGVAYAITGFEVINPFGDYPAFLEIQCQR